MVTLYGIKTCDTCRKARRTLDDLGIAYRYHDLRTDGLDAARLDALLARSDWKTLLNTRSTTWRGLDDADKRDLDADRARSLLLAHPTLLKRPVLETPNHFLVGFKADAYRALQAP